MTKHLLFQILFLFLHNFKSLQNKKMVINLRFYCCIGMINNFLIVYSKAKYYLKYYNELT